MSNKSKPNPSTDKDSPKDFDRSELYRLGMIEAAKESDYNTIRELVKLGVSVNVFEHEHYDIVDGVRRKIKSGYAPIFHAIDREDIELFNFLIKLGAEINLTASDGFTPLMEAVKNASYKFTRMMVEDFEALPMVKYTDPEGNKMGITDYCKRINCVDKDAKYDFLSFERDKYV